MAKKTKIDKGNIDNRIFQEWRTKTGVGPVMFQVFTNDANAELKKLEGIELMNRKLELETKLNRINANAILAMNKGGNEYEKKLSYDIAKRVFFDSMATLTMTWEAFEDRTSHLHIKEGIKTVYDTYDYAKRIKDSQVADILPKFDALIDLYKYWYNDTPKDDEARWNVAMQISDVRKAIAERKFEGLRKLGAMTSEEKEDIKKEYLVKYEYDELGKLHPNIKPRELSKENIKEPKDNIDIAYTLINEGLIVGVDILGALEGLCMQLGIIWNDKDIVNTVDTSIAILQQYIDDLNLDVDKFNMEIDTPNIQSITDTDTLFKLMDTSQRFALDCFAPEYIFNAIRRYKKFNKNVAIDGVLDEKVDASPDCKQSADNMSYLGIMGVRQLHDRIVSNYGDKEEVVEKDKDGNDKKVINIKLNGKVIVASIIYHLFIERIMKNSKFIRGLECLFNGFLPVTGAVWESFAQKLDKAVENVNVKFDEEMLKTYKETMGAKIKDYTGDEEEKKEIDITVPEELIDPVTKEIPNILKAVKEELTGEKEDVIPKDFKYSGTMEHPVNEETLIEELDKELTELGVEKKEKKIEELDEEGKKILNDIQKKASDILENIDEVEKRSKEALEEIMEETETE